MLQDSDKRQLKETYERAQKIINGDEQLPKFGMDGMVPKDTYNQLVNLYNDMIKDVKSSAPQVNYDISNINLQTVVISGIDVTSEEYDTLVSQYNDLIRTYANMTVKMIENMEKKLTISNKK